MSTELGWFNRQACRDLTSQCLSCFRSIPGQVKKVEEATSWTRTTYFSNFIIFIQDCGPLKQRQQCEDPFSITLEKNIGEKHVAASKNPSVIQPCQLWFRPASEDFLGAFLRPWKAPCICIGCHSSQVICLHHLNHMWCASWIYMNWMNLRICIFVSSDPQVACFLFSSQNPIRFPWSDGFTQQTFKFSWASLLKIPNSGTDLNQTRLLWFWEPDTNQTRTGVIPVGQSQNIKNPLLWWNSVPKRRQTA